MSLLAQLDLPVRNRTELSEELFGKLRQFIYEKTGIYFQDNKRYLLESRVGQRLRALGLNDFHQYFQLMSGSGAMKELPLLVNAITINETFFFRNPAKFEMLEHEIIPSVVEARVRDGKRTVRIWSAACSTGDEPYTIAIIVLERLQQKYPYIQFEIVGTDINTDVLEQAREGSYNQYAVRNVPPNVLRKYFAGDGNRYALKPEVRRLVSFQQLNLVDRGAMMRMRGFDVVLCANVLIYFDVKAKQQVVSALYNSINPGGFLLVGFSETLYGVTQSFQPVRFAKTIAYKKG